MEFKEKFKTFIDKQKNNLKSPTSHNSVSEAITKEEFDGRIAVFSQSRSAIPIFDDKNLSEEAEQAVIDSIESFYFEEDGQDVGEHELTKYPNIENVHVINGIRSRLRKQQAIVSRKVSNLIGEKQSLCTEEINKIGDIINELNMCVNLCMTGRTKLKQGRMQFTSASLGVLANYSKRQRVANVIESLRTIHTLQMTDVQLRKLLLVEDYPGAIQLLLECQKAAATFKHFKCISDLSTKLQETLEKTEDELDVALSKMASNFSPIIYEKLFIAYDLLGKSQTLMDQLHMHLTSHIHNSAFTIVLGYVELYNTNSSKASSNNDSPSFSKLQYSELARKINKECFISCFLDLSKGMWNILKNYRNIINWHKNHRDVGVKSIESSDSEYTESERYIKQKLEHGLLRIWQDVQAKMRTFILAYDLSQFKFDDFLKVLDIINKLIDVGKFFCGSKSETLQDSIKKQSFNFFRTHHWSRMEEIHMFLEHEGWEVCPVKESFSVNQLIEFRFLKIKGGTPIQGHPNSPRKDLLLKKEAFDIHESENPFDFPSDESIEEDIMADELSETILTDDSDEDVADELKRDFVEERMEEQKSHLNWRKPSDLNKVPMLTNTTLTILRLFGKYIQMMHLLQPIAFDVMICLSQLFEYYMYSVVTIFSGKGLEEPSLSPRMKTTLQRIRETIIISNQDGENYENGHKVMSPSISPNIDLLSPDSLHGLPTRIVAVESLVFMSQQLEFLHGHIEILMPNSKITFLNQFYSNTVQLTGEIRQIVYSHVAENIVDYDSVLNQMCSVKWDINDLRSQHNSFVDNLLRQLQVISMRISDMSLRCSIPVISVDSLWSATVSKVNRMLLEGFASPKKCSNEGRSLMQLDYQQFIMKLESLTKVRPLPDKSLVEAYIKAYYLPDSSLIEWILANKQMYTMKQLLSLTNCMTHVGKKTKQKVAQLLDDPR